MSIAPLKLDNDIQFIPSSICLILYPMKKETTTKITKKLIGKGFVVILTKNPIE